MADFPPARTADASGFAHREIREIVVQDEFLFAFAAGVGIELLSILAGAESRECHGLSFPAAKYCRTVSARQNSNFAPDGAHLVERTAIQTLGLIHDQSPHRLLLNVIKRIFEDEL